MLYSPNEPNPESSFSSCLLVGSASSPFKKLEPLHSEAVPVESHNRCSRERYDHKLLPKHLVPRHVIYVAYRPGSPVGSATADRPFFCLSGLSYTVDEGDVHLTMSSTSS